MDEDAVPARRDRGIGPEQEDDGEFEALARMDGEDADGPAVALQAEDGGVARLGAGLAHEPVEQRGGIAARAAHAGMDELGQVQQVGEGPFAAGSGRRHAGGEPGLPGEPVERREEAVLARRVGQLAEEAEVLRHAARLLRSALRGGERVDLRRLQPEERGEERGADDAGGGRGGDRRKEQAEGLRLRLPEDGLLLVERDGADAAVGELPRKRPGRAVDAEADEHRDVAGTEGAAFDSRRAVGIGDLLDEFGRLFQQGADFVGTDVRRLAAVRDRDELHGAVGRAVEFGHRNDIVLSAGGDDVLFVPDEARVPEGEGLARGRVVPEQGVHGGHDAGRGAAVFGKVVPPVFRYVAGGGRVGLDVAPAEGVDGLLGVADEKDGDARIPVKEGAAEDFVLDRIGVLELVDEHGAVLLAQRGDQGRGGGAVRPQRLAQAKEHVAEVRLLPGRALGVPAFEKVEGDVEKDAARLVREGGFPRRVGGGRRGTDVGVLLNAPKGAEKRVQREDAPRGRVGEQRLQRRIAPQRDVGPPPVARGAGELRGLDLGGRVRVEGEPGLEGVALEGASAEAVDRGDGGPVEFDQGQIDGRRRASARVGVGERADELRGLPAARAGRAKLSLHLAEQVAEAGAQLLRRRVGEGHDEDLRDAPVRVFREEAHEQVGDVVGLSGPGGGLDEMAPGEREVAAEERGGEIGFHERSFFAALGARWWVR